MEDLSENEGYLRCLPEVKDVERTGGLCWLLA